MDEVGGYITGGLILVILLLYLVAFLVAGVVIVLAYTLAAIYSFLVVLTQIIIMGLDAIFSAQLVPNSPWVMWAVWGMLIGGALGFWTVAPVYRLRILRPLIVAAPITLLAVVAGMALIARPAPLIIPPLDNLPVLSNQELQLEALTACRFAAPLEGAEQSAVRLACTEAQAGGGGPELVFSLGDAPWRGSVSHSNYKNIPLTELEQDAHHAAAGCFDVAIMPCHPGPEAGGADGQDSYRYQGYYLLEVRADGQPLALGCIDAGGAVQLWDPQAQQWHAGADGEAGRVEYAVPALGGVIGLQRQFDVHALQLQFAPAPAPARRCSSQRGAYTFAFPAGELQLAYATVRRDTAPAGVAAAQFAASLPKYATPPHWRTISVPLKCGGVAWKDQSALYMHLLQLNIGGKQITMEQFSDEAATGRWTVPVYRDDAHNQQVLELRVQLTVTCTKMDAAPRQEKQGWYAGAYTVAVYDTAGVKLGAQEIGLKPGAGDFPLELPAVENGKRGRVTLASREVHKLTLSRNNTYSPDEHYYYSMPDAVISVALEE